EAVRSFLQYTNDYDFVKLELYTVLKDIIDAHIRGTRYGIRMDEDGLLVANGKAVEVQALWYNALRVMLGVARHFDDSSFGRMVADIAGQARLRFNKLFWNEESACLVDCVNGHERDSSIRPNQIFAVSLTHSMLDADRAKLLVKTVETDLFTPVGLRTQHQG